jgi:hypothetical protein
MASQEKREAMRAARTQTAHAVIDADRMGGKDLADAKVQENILELKPQDLVLSTQTLKIYPMSARRARQFHGFATSVVASALQDRNASTGAGQSSGQVTTLFLAGILAQSEKLTNDLLTYVAYSTDAPGKVSDAIAVGLVEEFNESFSATDLLTAYAFLADVSGYTRSIEERAKEAKKDLALSKKTG